MEIRYIIFTRAETRDAIVSFVGKEYNTREEDITHLEIAGDNETPRVVVRVPTKPIKLSDADLVNMLLRYCREMSIPIPRRSQKSVKRSPAGPTLTLKIDLTEVGHPTGIHDQIAYRDMTVTQELSTVKQELARALARAQSAERKLVEADQRLETVVTV